MKSLVFALLALSGAGMMVGDASAHGRGDVVVFIGPPVYRPPPSIILVPADPVFVEVVPVIPRRSFLPPHRDTPCGIEHPSSPMVCGWDPWAREFRWMPRYWY